MTTRGLLGEQGRGTQLKGLHLGSSRVWVLPPHSGDHQMLRRTVHSEPWGGVVHTGWAKSWGSEGRELQGYASLAPCSVRHLSPTPEPQFPHL